MKLRQYFGTRQKLSPSSAEVIKKKDQAISAVLLPPKYCLNFNSVSERCDESILVTFCGQKVTLKSASWLAR
jgi:hypothetical protein